MKNVIILIVAICLFCSYNGITQTTVSIGTGGMSDISTLNQTSIRSLITPTIGVTYLHWIKKELYLQAEAKHTVVIGRKSQVAHYPRITLGAGFGEKGWKNLGFTTSLMWSPQKNNLQVLLGFRIDGGKWNIEFNGGHAVLTCLVSYEIN